MQTFCLDPGNERIALETLPAAAEVTVMFTVTVTVTAFSSEIPLIGIYSPSGVRCAQYLA